MRVKINIVVLLTLCGLFLTKMGYSQEYSYDHYSNSKSHQEYLESDVELTEFDRNQWEIIKRSIVDGISEEEYEIVEEGGYVLQDEDNPYQQSRRSFKKYWKKKNAHRPKTLPKKEEKKNRKNNSNWSIPSGLSGIITALVIALFAFLIFYLFFKAPIERKSKNIPGDIDSVIPTEIPKTELELLLDEALAREDYREAIRIYFIFIIRGLIVKDWIVWEKEKTNFSYLLEMRDKPYSNEFESTVSVYEIVWYGERELTKEEYDLLEPRFKNLVKNLEQ